MNGSAITMESIKSQNLEPKNKNISKNIFKISLCLALITFVLTMTSSSSSFSILKPASAAPLTSMSVSPTSNIINELATYSFQFKTATAGTIKTIEISFPSSFDVSGIRLVERDGISSGSLSSTGSTIKYTVGSPQSIAAGSSIRLEIARIIATAEGSFTVSIKTLDSQAGTIDGPTTSGPFIIKSITGNDISPSFMIRKTLHDDTAGNGKGWTPSGAQFAFEILDSDLLPLGTGTDSTFVSIVVQDDTDPICAVTHIGLSSIPNPGFRIFCEKAPANNAQLHYVITKLPPNLIVSSASASASASASSQYESVRAHDQIASEFP